MLMIIDHSDQLLFMVNHYEETKHNNFGLEFGETDLKGGYSKMRGNVTK